MRKRFSKIISFIVICFVLVFSLVGCKKDSNNEPNSNNNTKQGETQKPDINQERPSSEDLDPMQEQPDI